MLVKYVDLVSNDENEVCVLSEMLLIGVIDFFWDEGVFVWFVC